MKIIFVVAMFLSLNLLADVSKKEALVVEQPSEVAVVPKEKDKVKEVKVEEPKAKEKVKEAKVEEPKAKEKVKEAKVEEPKAKENKETKVEEPKSQENKEAKVETPKAEEVKETAKEASQTPYNREDYFGKLTKDEKGNNLVVENDKQVGPDHYADYALVKVTGIPSCGDKARVRIAVWDSEKNYAVEGVAPFRACSHWAKDATNGEMVFKIGLKKDKKYAFFAHLDKKNTGKVKKVLGIPTEPYMFTSAKNNGVGEGIKREGLSTPKFENTAVKYTGPGQVIALNL